jgi:hypothetical protein
MPMKTVRTEIQYVEKSPRLELLIRIPYCIVLHLISAFLSSAVLIVLTIIHALYILLLGKRHSTLDRLMKSIVFYGSRANYYTYLLTDERPPIIPELF